MSTAVEAMPGPVPVVASANEGAHVGTRAEALEWEFHPWVERRGRAIAAALVALAMCLVLARLGEGWIVTLGLSLAAVGAMAPLLSSYRCRLDGDGVARSGPLGWERRRWSELRRARLSAQGLLVSPYAAARWLDPYRGLFLPLPRSGREALSLEIRSRLDAHGL